MNQDIYKSDYDYEIPEKLIARYPPKNRTDSRLLLCKDQNFSIENFSSISNFFNKDDLIVFNETKVFKARLRLQKESGGQTEIFINRILSKFEAECLTKGLNLKKKSQVLKTDTFPLKITIVGLGTFKPLSNEVINDSSKLHEENFFISDESAKKINSQLKDKKRIIAIGTTTLRALESSWNNETNSVSPGKQTTTIFIKEGFKFNVANALLTNFHLPQSSLLMLVCAFAGKELIFSTYEFAIKNNLRFFSYGDAMIIERCPLNY